jgi:hypothetical protein
LLPEAIALMIGQNEQTGRRDAGHVGSVGKAPRLAAHLTVLASEVERVMLVSGKKDKG